ncbi:MAG: type II toxin-antitoxin system YafQ family toxin [Lachnospiraceae bacterium]|nr:type II toxin-antitoxin system YafQ family toxin [Lachnospiraceae bacterium]
MYCRILLIHYKIGEALDGKYCDHALIGDYIGHKECYIQPDWLLIYQVNDDALILMLGATGTHTDLFKYYQKYSATVLSDDPLFYIFLRLTDIPRYAATFTTD